MFRAGYLRAQAEKENGLNYELNSTTPLYLAKRVGF